MSAVLLHVGLHKCASSYLQERVFPRMAARYLKLGNYPGPQGALFDELCVAERFEPADFSGRIAARAAGGPDDCRPLVLSHEGLSGPPQGGCGWDAVRVAERLRAVYPDARILLIVRNQAEYMLSLYAYRVCVNGLTWRGAGAYFRAAARGGLVEKLSYHRLVESYHALFSPERVLVLPVEMLAREETAFLRRVCAFGGVSLPPEDESRLGSRRVNASSRSLRVLSACRLANAVVSLTVGVLASVRQRPVADALRRHFMHFKVNTALPLLSRWPGRVLLALPPDVFASCAGAFASSNVRLAELAKVDLAKYGYLMEADSHG